MTVQLLSFAFVSALLFYSGAVQQPTPPAADRPPTSARECPMHDDHTYMDDHAKMNERGEKGMGFSQSATTHHFLLKPDGGVIQVETNDPRIPPR